MDTCFEDLFKGATPKIFSNARSLRTNLTKAEDLLWQQLRNRKLMGLKFRRQHPLNLYILDFYCAEKKLAIEVDGEIHNKKEVIEKDETRTRELTSMQIHILRFANKEVENNMKTVLEKIKDYVNGKG